MHGSDWARASRDLIGCQISPMVRSAMKMIDISMPNVDVRGQGQLFVAMDCLHRHVLIVDSVVRRYYSPFVHRTILIII